MSKRRSSERGAGETSGRASKLQCPGISGSNAKRAGPFILGKEATHVLPGPQKYENSSLSETPVRLRLHLVCIFVWVVFLCVAGCLCVYVRLRQECQEFCWSPWHRPENVWDCAGARLPPPPPEDVFLSHALKLFFYYTTQLQSAKENITLAVLMGTSTCSL